MMTKIYTLSMLFALPVLLPPIGANAQDKDKPNIIFILVDDMGIGDIGAYGQQLIQTPNIDLMAKEGMIFNNFYAGSTVCAPSRASLMTGQHTGHTQVRGNGEFPLHPDKKILPELLKEAGYTTAMFGKWGLGLEGTTGSPEKRGWDYFLGHLHHVDAHFQRPDSLDIIKDGEIAQIKVEEGRYANDLFAEGALDFIKDHEDKEPFFLYLSFTVPHAELVVPDQYLEEYLTKEGKSKFSPEEAWPDGKHYGQQDFPKAAYAALVTSIDDYVGEVMKALKEEGLGGNTLIIFTSDNGTHVEGGRTIEDVDFFQSNGASRGVKRDLYNGGIKTPFIARWPGHISAGTETDHVSAFWDIYPTFAALTDNKVTSGKIDGISFLPELLGKEQKEKHAYLYWEFHEQGGKQAILKGNWKAIRLNVGKNPQNQIELYNLDKDPEEKINLAEKYPKRTQEMAKLLDSIRTPNSNFNFGRKDDETLQK